jgi:lipoprotein NlpD
MNFTALKQLFTVILLALLSSCTSVGSNYAPVNTPHPDTANKITKEEITYQIHYHLVKKGQTLYAISRLFGLNVQQLAQWNQIAPPYKVNVGQKLRVSNPIIDKNISYGLDVKNISPEIREVEQGRVQPKIEAVVAEENQKNINTTLINRTSSQKKNATLLNNTPNLTYKPSYNSLPISNTTDRSRSSLIKKSSISIDNESMLKLNFRWPMKGEVLKAYSKVNNKGIDIAGEIGQDVSASESGTVVYSGQGLIGYGQLLIIKHNDLYLSAYANNSSLLVEKGCIVEKGQTIAKIGQVGIHKTSLHFEIRKNGKPVNPLSLLPKNH